MKNSFVILLVIVWLPTKLLLFHCSLAGAVAVVVGLYVVLWGKAKDLKEIKLEMNSRDDSTRVVKILIDETSKQICKLDLQEPLLAEKSSDVSKGEMNH